MPWKYTPNPGDLVIVHKHKRPQKAMCVPVETYTRKFVPRGKKTTSTEKEMARGRRNTERVKRIESVLERKR